jgi:hypothetical protein
MNWPIIFLLSAFGLIMGWLGIKGYTQKIEPWLWLCLAIFTVLVLSKNVNDKLFIHGLYTGVSWGVLNGVLQVVFFQTYLTNNPLLIPDFDKITYMPAKYFPLLTGPIAGLIIGGVIGGSCLLIRKYI